MLVAAGDEDEHAFLVATADASCPRTRARARTSPTRPPPPLERNHMTTPRQFPKRTSKRLVTEVRGEIVVGAGRGRTVGRREAQKARERHGDRADQRIRQVPGQQGFRVQDLGRRGAQGQRLLVGVGDGGLFVDGVEDRLAVRDGGLDDQAGDSGSERGWEGWFWC